MHDSPIFEREGDSWQLRLTPFNESGNVGLFLGLVSKGRPGDYSVLRWYRVRVLHPTDAARSVWLPRVGFLGPFTFAELHAWGVHDILRAENYAEFLHNGWVTLQALVWQPTAAEIAAAAHDPRSLQLLYKSFSSTAKEVVDRVVAHQGGSISRAFVELLQWSPVERKQQLKNEVGRKIVTWRVPLEQCQCAQQGKGRGEISLIAADCLCSAWLPLVCSMLRCRAPRECWQATVGRVRAGRRQLAAGA